LIIPYTYNKVSVLLLGFLFGMVVDIANNTMGIHAAAATIVAYLRPRLLLSITNRTQINDIKDTRQTSAMDWFFKYAMFLVFIFNVVLIMTETFSFKNISVTLLRIVCSTLVSGFLILLYYFIALKEKQD
ncbi:rod shape-determining protein MreD, partial [Odoribacter sp. OttesenSCG-928-J03]|nr:rod shape-determining protein MreD [Odoribacter sp. OttesenSCG-928-J03]